MTSRNGANIGYTSYDLPNVINAPGGYSSTLSYGAFRNRYKQVAVGAAGPETTIYVAGLLEKVTNAQGTHYRHYIHGGKGTAAIHSRTVGGSNATVYLHRDHLGSPELITGSAGDVLVRPSFAAYGERRDGSDWEGPISSADQATLAGITRRGFTGHEHLDAVGLIHMNGRVYEPVAGRFLGRDPFIDGFTSSQGANGYAYVRNSPLSFVDPSGYECRIDPLTGNLVDCELPPISNLCAWYGPYAAGCPRNLWEEFQGWDPYGFVHDLDEYKFDDFGGGGGGDGGDSPSQPADDAQTKDKSSCWNGEQGDWEDLLGGWARRVGNDLVNLFAYTGLASMPSVSIGDALSAYEQEPLGANNTSLGILGADLAPASEVLAGSVMGGAGLIRGGARIELGNWKQAGNWFFPGGTRGPHFHFGSGAGLQSHHLPWESGNWLKNLASLAGRGEAGKDVANIALIGGGVAVAATAATSGGGCP